MGDEPEKNLDVGRPAIAVAIAKDVVKSILKRKRKLENEPPVLDIAWQYASGMVQGALEVVRALERAVAAEGGVKNQETP